MSTTEKTSEFLLEIKNISRSFSGVAAVQNASFEVEAGQIVGLIGPNGAGKTTALNCLSGIDLPDSGQVLLRGEDVTQWSIHRRARHGLGRTFQLMRLFPSLSVIQNVSLPLECGPLSRIAGGSNVYKSLSKSEVLNRATNALERVGLGAISRQSVGSLTAGQKRLVEIARLVAMDNDVLLLDEPAAGLNLTEGNELFEIISDLAKSGKGILLVEHRIRSVLQVVQRLVVMDHGIVIADGAPTKVMNLPSVQEAYMGVSANVEG